MGWQRQGSGDKGRGTLVVENFEGLREECGLRVQVEGQLWHSFEQVSDVALEL